MEPTRDRAPACAARRSFLALVAGSAVLAAMPARSATSASQLASSSKAALNKLIATLPAASALAKDAKAVLVFPKVTKAGLGIGGQYGDGALIQGGKVVAYYNTAGASVGLQAGAQTFGYALFFMNDGALAQLNKNDGFEVGVGPSVVVLDQGMAKSATTTTMKDDIYAFIFRQQGLMAGVGVQGNKITKINPK